MIVRHLVDLAHAAEQLEQAPHLRLRRRRSCRDIAHARRTEALVAAEQRRDRGSRASRRPASAARVAGQPHPGAVERNRRARARAPAASARKAGAGRRGSSAGAAARRRCRAGRDSRCGRPRAPRRARAGASQTGVVMAMRAPRTRADAMRSQRRTASRRLRAAERTVARKRREVDVIRRAVEQRGERGLRALRCPWASSCARRSGVRRLRAGARRSRKRPPPMVRCADGVAQHEAVAGRGRDRPLEHELHQCLARPARSAHRRAARRAPRPRSARVMQPHRRPLRRAASPPREHAQASHRCARSARAARGSSTTSPRAIASLRRRRRRD